MIIQHIQKVIRDLLTLYAPLASPPFTGTVSIALTATFAAGQTPVQTVQTSPNPGSGSDINRGNKFTVNIDGRITHLAGKYGTTGGSKIVRLYDSTGTQIASVTLTPVAGTWVRVALATPILVTSGSWFIVSSHSSDWYEQSGLTPVTTGDITINEERYIMGSDSVPNNTTGFGIISGYDVTFEPATIAPPIDTTYPSYASNAAAIAGGLTAGKHYRNGDNVCVVH